MRSSVNLGVPNHSSDPDGNTPFSLVYGCEVVIPLEIQMPSLRVALMTRMTKEDNDRLRLQELEALNEKRLQAQ